MIVVKMTQKKGRGVFATEDIPPGTFIELCEIIKINAQDTKALIKTSLSCYIFDGDNGGSILVLGNGSLYNHSKNANCETRIMDEVGKRDLMLYIAIKHIKKGDEILIDYGYDPK